MIRIDEEACSDVHKKLLGTKNKEWYAYILLLAQNDMILISQSLYHRMHWTNWIGQSAHHKCTEQDVKNKRGTYNKYNTVLYVLCKQQILIHWIQYMR